MNTTAILGCIAFLLLVFAFWDDKRRSEKPIHPSTKTYLMVASILSIVAALTSILI